MAKKSESMPAVADYWNSVASRSQGAGREDLWRAHLKEVYQRLRARWRNEGWTEHALKTDLYDEAISRHHLISLLGGDCRHIVGADVSFETAQAAKERLEKTWRRWDQIAVSDARDQAFKTGSFGEILSNSTLDHFLSRNELLASLEELHRIMKQGGSLIITLDNPQNPVVWIRNRLPYRLLKRFGIIPYYMGATLSRSELVRALESKGFAICDSTVIVHSPRILAIWAGCFIGRLQREGIKAGFAKLLGFFERLERFPTRHITGYYVAVKALKI